MKNNPLSSLSLFISLRKFICIFRQHVKSIRYLSNGKKHGLILKTGTSLLFLHFLFLKHYTINQRWLIELNQGGCNLFSNQRLLIYSSRTQFSGKHLPFLFVSPTGLRRNTDNGVSLVPWPFLVLNNDSSHLWLFTKSTWSLHANFPPLRARDVFHGEIDAFRFHRILFSLRVPCLVGFEYKNKWKNTWRLFSWKGCFKFNPLTVLDTLVKPLDYSRGDRARFQDTRRTVLRPLVNDERFSRSGGKRRVGIVSRGYQRESFRAKGNEHD